MIVELGRAQEGREAPQEDHGADGPEPLRAREPPEGAQAETRPRRRLGLSQPRHGQQRQAREAGRQREGALRRNVRRQPAASRSRQHDRGVEHADLRRLVGAGLSLPLALLHHDGVADHVGEDKADVDRRQQRQQRPVAGLAPGGQRGQGTGPQQAGEDHVRPTAQARDRHEVREQAEERLDQHRQRHPPDERGALRRAQAQLVLEQVGHGLVDDPAHALGEIAGREEEVDAVEAAHPGDYRTKGLRARRTRANLGS